MDGNDLIHRNDHRWLVVTHSRGRPVQLAPDGLVATIDRNHVAAEQEPVVQGLDVWAQAVNLGPVGGRTACNDVSALTLELTLRTEHAEQAVHATVAGLEGLVQDGEGRLSQHIGGNYLALPSLERLNVQAAKHVVGLGELAHQDLEAWRVDVPGKQVDHRRLGGTRVTDEQVVVATEDAQQDDPDSLLALDEGAVQLLLHSQEVLANIEHVDLRDALGLGHWSGPFRR